MGKVSTQLPFMCGHCKNFFGSERALKDHVNAKHAGYRVAIYRQFGSVDLRDNEPSFADRAIEAQIAMHSGLPTDDAWLLGE